MTLSRSHIAALTLVAATAAVGALAYWRLPEGATIPVHYTVLGRVSGAAPAGHVLAIIPTVSVLVVGALALAPSLPVFRGQIARSVRPFGIVLVAIAAVLFTAEASLAAKAMDPAFDVLRTVFLAVAVLLVVVGNFLGKIRQNHLFGVRTPWTLADERIWDKTHRFTGWAMVLAGFALAVIDFAAPGGAWLIAATVICAASPLFVGIAYSARQWRREHRT